MRDVGARYTPSSLERAWENRTSSNCRLIQQQARDHAVDRWLHIAWDAMFNNTSASLDASLSRMRTSDGCTEPIEPLTGSLRHPRALQCDNHPFKRGTGKSIMDITYLILADGCDAAACSGSRRRGRRLFYDLGCAWSGPNPGTWDKYLKQFGRRRRDNESHEDYAQNVFRERLRVSTTIAPTTFSIPLFRSLYERHCLDFEHVYAWEAEQFRAGAWMARVPAADRSKTSFFNEPVNATNALDVLRHSARADDFVVVKLDIDYPDLEDLLIKRILHEEPLHGLIDELFFEYHGNVDDDKAAPEHRNQTVAHGIRMMGALRRLGVRAHFWV